MTVQVDSGILEALAIAAVLLLLAQIIPYLIDRYRRYRGKMFMGEVSLKLGFSYQSRGDVGKTEAKSLAGGQMLDVISGTYDDIAVRVFIYRLLTSGEVLHWSPMTVFETPVSAKLADIVLRPDRLNLNYAANAALTRTTLLGLYEAVELEGNFAKYFTLYAKKGSRIETLEIFTPDIMANMVDHYQSYSLEFSNGMLYLYPMKLIKHDEEFMRALTLLNKLAKRLSPVFTAMRSA